MQRENSKFQKFTTKFLILPVRQNFKFGCKGKSNFSNFSEQFLEYQLQYDEICYNMMKLQKYYFFCVGMKPTTVSFIVVRCTTMPQRPQLWHAGLNLICREV